MLRNIFSHLVSWISDEKLLKNYLAFKIDVFQNLKKHPEITHILFDY